MSTGNTKLSGEVYVSQPIQAVWQAFLRWKKTNLGTTAALVLLVMAMGFLGIFLILLIISLNAAAGGITPPDNPAMLVNWLIEFGWFTMLIGFFGFLLLLLPFGIAVDYSFVSSQNDRKVTVGTALKRGYTRLFVAIGTYLLAFLIVIGGLILLIIPGIYFALRLGYLNSIIANENLGVVENIRRSWALTKGNLWDIIGAASVNGIILYTVGILTSVIILATNAAGIASLGTAISTVLAIAMVALSVATAVGIYFRYHQSALEKEGKLKKEGTDKLNYMLFVIAILLSFADNALTLQTTPVTQPEIQNEDLDGLPYFEAT